MDRLLFNSKTQITISLTLLVAFVLGVWNISSKATAMTIELGSLRKAVTELTNKMDGNKATVDDINRRLIIVESFGSEPLRKHVEELDGKCVKLTQDLFVLRSTLREHQIRTGDVTPVTKSGDKSSDEIKW